MRITKRYTYQSAILCGMLDVLRDEDRYAREVPTDLEDDYEQGRKEAQESLGDEGEISLWPQLLPIICKCIEFEPSERTTKRLYRLKR